MEKKWYTIDGRFHQDFEMKLKKYLEVEHLNQFVNDTIALIARLKAYRINSGKIVIKYFL